MTRLESSESYETKNQYWLTPKEVTEWLQGLQDGNFPMTLLTKRYKNATDNGYLSQQKLFQTPWYQAIIQPEVSLLEEIWKSWELPYYQKYHDIGVWNGEKTAKFLLSMEDKRPTIIYISDILGNVVGDAKITLGRYGIKDQDIIEDITDFLRKHVKASQEKCLHVSLWAGYGNTKDWDTAEEERNILHTIPNQDSSLLISVFKKPKTEDGWKRHMKAYGWNGDGDNKEAYEASKNQIDGLLRALGFSDQNLQTTKLRVQIKKELDNGNRDIEVCFISENDIKIEHEWKEYHYQAWAFYKVYHSGRFLPGYFHQKVKALNKTRKTIKGDKVSKTRANEDRLVCLIEKGLSKDEKMQLQKARTQEQISQLLGIGWFIWFFALMFWCTFGVTIYKAKVQKEAYQERIFSHWLEWTKYDTIQQRLSNVIASFVLTESINENAEIATTRDEFERAWRDGVLDWTTKEFLIEEWWLYNQEQLRHIWDAIFPEYVDLSIKQLFQDFLARKGFYLLPMDDKNTWEGGLARYYGALSPLFTDSSYIHAIFRDSVLKAEEYAHLWNSNTPSSIEMSHDLRYLKLYDWTQDKRRYAFLIEKDGLQHIRRYDKSREKWWNVFHSISYQEHIALCQQYRTMITSLRWVRYIPFIDPG